MLHPQARRAVEVAAGEPKVFDESFDIEASRRAARAEAAAHPRVSVAEVRDLDAGGVPCRLYRPDGAAPGVVVHLHGGGFVFHDVDVHDNLARLLAVRSGRAVLSVDYPGRVQALALVYPFLDPTAGFDSYRTAADGFDPREAAWYWQQYAASPDDLRDPDLAPLLSERLHTLPPTLVTTAEHDPLRDEGEALAVRLAEAGVTVTATRYLGQVHGVYRHPDQFDAAEPMLAAVAGFLAAYLR